MVRKKEKGRLEIWYQPLGRIRANCYLMMAAETKEALLVDPADDLPAIIAMQKEAGASIRGILLTHGHFDHITAAQEASGYFHAELYAARAEQELLADPVLNCSCDMGEKAVALEAGHWLSDGDRLSFGELQLEAIATPGHTRGGMCYYFPQDAVLLSGDTLFLEMTGRTDLPTGSAAELLHSLQEKLMTLPEDTLVLPGHGPFTSIGYEKRNNPYIQEGFWE